MIFTAIGLKTIKKIATERFTDLRQAKITYGGLVLGSSQFLLLLQLPQKRILALNVV